MNWKPGDIAIIQNCHPVLACYNGTKCTVTSSLMPLFNGKLGYTVQLHCVKSEHRNASHWTAMPWNLRKPDDPFDAGSWDDCVWKPDAIRRRETVAKIEALNELADELLHNDPDHKKYGDWVDSWGREQTDD